MNYEQFCFWLKGKIDFHSNTPNEEEWGKIKLELNKVFSSEKKEDENYIPQVIRNKRSAINTPSDSN